MDSHWPVWTPADCVWPVTSWSVLAHWCLLFLIYNETDLSKQILVNFAHVLITDQKVCYLPYQTRLKPLAFVNTLMKTYISIIVVVLVVKVFSVFIRHERPHVPRSQNTRSYPDHNTHTPQHVHRSHVTYHHVYPNHRTHTTTRTHITGHVPHSMHIYRKTPNRLVPRSQDRSVHM